MTNHSPLGKRKQKKIEKVVNIQEEIKISSLYFVALTVP